MRRATLLSAFLVGLLFAALAHPAAPFRRLLLDAIAVRGTVSKPAALGAPVAEKQGAQPLRVAIAAMISPERTYSAYGALFSELGRRLGRPVELVQRHSYAEVNDLLGHDGVDMAWICTGAWPHVRDAQTARLLAVPVVGGKTTYGALVVVGPNSTASGLSDLSGRTFAFTDPLSLTGCLYPRGAAERVGKPADAFFGSTFYTHGHDLSIEAVRRGLADAASVDSLVYDYLCRKSPEEVAGLRVVDRSPPYPIPPLVVPARVPATASARLRDTLLAMGRDPAGRTLMDALLIDEFRQPDDAAYASMP